MKKNVTTIISLLLIAGILEGCGHQHVWKEPTCTEPKTCMECGETEGNPLGHTWADATCTDPKTCSVCEETEGGPLGHTWADATCTDPKTCSVCGETEGGPLGHTWADATCTDPKTCSVCGETEGDPIEHNVDYYNGKCRACHQQIIKVTEIEKDDVEDYFDITYTSTAESPCTYSVKPKDDGYKYKGRIYLKIYQGKKASYGGFAEYANTLRETTSIDLDENGCGSTTVTFPDYGYHIRSEIAVSTYVVRYKE